MISGLLITIKKRKGISETFEHFIQFFVKKEIAKFEYKLIFLLLKELATLQKTSGEVTISKSWVTKKSLGAKSRLARVGYQLYSRIM